MLRVVSGDGTGDGMCLGLLTATAGDLTIGQTSHWADFTIIGMDPVSGPGADPVSGAAGSCQILARSSTGQGQPARDNEHDRTRIGAGQARSVRVAGPGGYQ